MPGWTNKLQRVCGDDENWNRLAKGIEAIFQREVQEFESQPNERWIVATS